MGLANEKVMISRGYGKGLEDVEFLNTQIVFSSKAIFSKCVCVGFCCYRRKGRYLSFQMDLPLQERLSKKKVIMLDLNLRELEGVFSSLNTSYQKKIDVINLHRL